MDLHRLLKEKRINELFDSLYIGVHVIDEKGITILYNTTCEEIEGIDRNWIIGKDMRGLVKEGVYSESVALQVLEKGEMISKTQRVNNKNIFSTASPIFDKGKLSSVIVSVLDTSSLGNIENQLNELRKVNNLLKEEISIINELNRLEDRFISNSIEMKRIKDLALRIAKVDSTILIEGESGVGKGVLSNYIHEKSNRSDHPFIKIDCSSIPENLIESELFGYEGGAFTGANKNGKVGLIQLADKGTLFLDEIGDISYNMQIKLLHVLQERVFQRVGGTDQITVDTRIIAATNKNLLQLVEQGKFREDLYYRLKVVPITIPPLRDRKEDILPLIKTFLSEFNKKYQMNKEISKAALIKLTAYHWPGNIRELENEIERLVVVSEGNSILGEDVLFDRRLDDLTENIGQAGYKDIVEQYEIKLLNSFIGKSKDINELSSLTGLEKSTIRKKAKRLGVVLDYNKGIFSF